MKSSFCLASFFMAGAALLSSCRIKDAGLKELTPGTDGSIAVSYQYPGDRGMWNHIFKSSEAYTVPEARPLSLILPHHDITVAQQNSMYRAVSKFTRPSVIVLIGPDHYEKATACIAAPTSYVSFTAPDGNLDLAGDLLEKLAGYEPLSSFVSFQDDLWPADHAVYAHTPFLKHYFPDSRFLPLLLKPLASDSEFDAFGKLADFLAEKLPDDALVVASVDFSHYQIPRVTALHDSVSRNTIQNRESPRHIEVDSPETLCCLTRYNELKKAVHPVLVDMTSTYDFIPDTLVESTSHQYWAFYPCQGSNSPELYVGDDTGKEETAIDEFRKKITTTSQRAFLADYTHTLNQTLLIAGSGNVGAGIRTFWNWDRYKSTTDRAEVLLRDLAGKEARFLSGFDALLFDPAPGSTFTQEKHGTILRIESIPVTSAESFEPQERQPQTIGILVLVADKTSSGEASLDILQFNRFFKYYDVVVLRYTDASSGTQAYLPGLQDSSSGKGPLFNLGVCHDESGNPIKGSLLALDWYDGKLKLETFDYESQTGTAPAVFQFLPDD
ncbi:MAG: AmmeMemoRadiSam system protein B [Treponema sp.]|nr:AmmeMemoRadiSam system protein B [Treponema sp.]